MIGEEFSVFISFPKRDFGGYVRAPSKRPHHLVNNPHFVVGAVNAAVAVGDIKGFGYAVLGFSN